MEEKAKIFQVWLHPEILEKFTECREILKEQSSRGINVTNAFVLDKALDAFLETK